MNRVLTLTRSDRVLLYEGAGDDWTCNDTGLVGRWPTLSPADDLFSLSVVDAAEGVTRLEVHDAGDASLVGVPFRSEPDGPAAIGPRVPHYALWSPNGEYLSYVVATSSGLSLFIARRSALDQAGIVLIGAPIFAAWLPDSSALIVHHGAELSSVDPATGRTRTITSEALAFRTPAVSSSTAIAFCQRAEERVEVVIREVGELRPLVRYDSGLVLGFRPNHNELTIATTSDPTTGVFDRLELVDTNSGERRKLWRSPYVGFWWSPGGERLVLLVPTQMGDGRYALYSLDGDGRIVAATQSIIPSDDTRLALGFFDQYQQSHAPWSADGSAFAVAGRVMSDGVSNSFGDPMGDFVLMWSAEPQASLRELGPGGIAGFSRVSS